MAVHLIPEDELRAALRPYRVAPEEFEAAVRERLRTASQRPVEMSLSRLPPWLRGAAALLPWQIFLGSKAKAAVAQLPLAAGIYKPLGYLAFPAISLFVLIGAAFYSARKIRAAGLQDAKAIDDEAAVREGVRDWWRQHKFGAILVYGVTLALPFFGASWALFALYIVSLGILVYVLTSLAKLGLGNRQVIGQSCLMGLILLGQLSAIPQYQGIHFVDASVISAIFFGGVLLLAPLLASKSAHIDWQIEKLPRWMYGLVPAQLLVTLIFWLVYPNVIVLVALLAGAITTWASIAYRASLSGKLMTLTRQRGASVMLVLILVPLMAWQCYPVLAPITPQQIARYAASFHEAPFQSASWRDWEIIASWTLEQRLDPDLSGARKLLAKEIAGEQNAFILGSAFRLGLVEPDQLSLLRDLAKFRKSLLDGPRPFIDTQQIFSPEYYDWVIRASLLGNDVSADDRDLLARRLHVTLDALIENQYRTLKEAWIITKLLAAIDRPVDPAEYRSRIHDWLRAYHSTEGGGFQPGGGFKTFSNMSTGSLDATSDAVELMEIYGVPEDLDLNWVQSYLRPRSIRPGNQKWIAAVTLDRLKRLPGVKPPTWFDRLYYDRSAVAAIILVGLCIYATASSPKVRIMDAADEGLNQ